MPETIICELSVALGSGPRWSSTRVIEVEATDVIRITIAAGASDRKVELQPGDAMQLLLINPESPADTLSYATSAGASSAHLLDQPHFLVGEGAIGLLGGSSAPTSLFFSNTGGEDAPVTIVIGRDATP